MSDRDAEGRPTCCETMRRAEAIDHRTVMSWARIARQPDGPGWAIIADWAPGDTGKGNEPEYAYATFCPFCGARLP